MIKVFNWAIPIVGYKAMTVWPFLFIRDDLMVPMNEVDYNHEEIHGRQQIEMLIVGAVIALILFVWGCGWWSLMALPVFFYWYVTEWFIRTLQARMPTVTYPLSRRRSSTSATWITYPCASRSHG